MRTWKSKYIILKASAITIIAIIVFISFSTAKIKNNNAISEELIPSEQFETSIEFPSLKDKNAASAAFQLGNGWTVKKVTGKSSEDIGHYIYNENKEEVGWSGIIQRSKDSDDCCFPEQFKSKDLRYKGYTKLGKGRIYLVGSDVGNENGKLARGYYAIIPISNEPLAYNFYIEKLEGKTVAETLEVVKDILVTAEDIEGQVRSMFKGDKASPENTENLISLLPLINWSKYAETDIEEFFDLAEWLGNLKISDIDSMVNLLNATNGLDGCYTDAYCSILKTSFFNNRNIFVKALGSLDEEQIKLVASFIQYDCNPEEVIEAVGYIAEVLNSNSLSADEWEAVEHHFLQSFKIELSGILTNTEMFYGRPNYGENPETDVKEYPYILKLDKPIKTAGVDIIKVQVVLLNEQDIKATHSFLNNKVMVQGSLFFAFTGHHHTELLIQVDKISEVTS